MNGAAVLGLRSGVICRCGWLKGRTAASTMVGTNVLQVTEYTEEVQRAYLLIRRHRACLEFIRAALGRARRPSFSFLLSLETQTHHMCPLVQLAFRETATERGTRGKWDEKGVISRRGREGGGRRACGSGVVRV